MRIAIIGQQEFGKAALEAFTGRGDTVAGVFCAPEKPGGRPDPLRLAAEQARIEVFQPASLQAEYAHEALRRLNVELGVMAYVLQFAPADFVNIPRHGMIQYHPSLLPHNRGPSSINWPIIRGDTRTGLTIFRPTDGLDEGPIILQRETPIGPDDTVASVYFDRLFPMGVQALLEAADLVVSGRATPRVQDESSASYEGWCRAAESRIHWHNHVDQVYNLIRGCNPAPGAWTLLNGRKLQLFDARKHPTHSFSQVRGKVGTVTQAGQSLWVAAQGGQIEVLKVRYDEGKKMPTAQFCSESGITIGTAFGE
ncbi:MAG: methionyl-tRNA formyltransferase [Sinobacteraceae bacterium]|nr:methionyl-tRNA formyltransferase [Nevskiaceae bacterium]